MATYTFSIPKFHITQIRSAHTDTLFAATALRVNNASGGLHRDWGAQSAALGDHKAEEDVTSPLTWANVDVPDPTPDNPDGGAVYWTYLLVNNGHTDSGWVEVLNKAADAAAGALAQGAVQGGTVNLANLGGLAVVLGLQEMMNLLTANCDGTVAVGTFAFTAAQLASMVGETGPVLDVTQDNPGTNSPAGCGANSDYQVEYLIQTLGNHHMEVAWLDRAGNVSWNWRDDYADGGAWHQPFSIATSTPRAGSPLVAVSRYPSHLEVAWLDAAGNISWNWRDDNVDGGAWHQPFSIATSTPRADSPLVAISRYPSHLEVLWIDSAGNISSNWIDDHVDGGAWHQPATIAATGSRAHSPLVAVSRYPSHLEVAWLDAAGNISWNWRDDNVDGGAWHQPFSIATSTPRADSPLVAISRYPSHLEVLWIDSAGNISSNWIDDHVDGGAWHQPATIAATGSRAHSPLVAVSRYPSHLEVAWLDAAGNISWNWRDDNVDGGAWHQPFSIATSTPRADSPLVAISRYPSHLEVLWIDSAGNISSNWIDDHVDGGAWHQPATIAATGSRAHSPLLAISRY